MSDTRAVPLETLKRANHAIDGGQPLCPSCVTGYLHPYKVSITVGEGYSWEGADYLVGWVAVCTGNRETLKHYKGSQAQPRPACGFSLPMTPHLFPHRAESGPS